MQYFQTETEFKKEALGDYAPRVQHLDWKGPGYYEFKHYNQRCPRG
jgi:hypothetical protein